MKKYTNIIMNGMLTLLVCLTISCGNKKDTHPLSLNVIPVASTIGNYNILDLSEYATEIRYIPLETNESSLIATITQIIYEDEKLFITDITSASVKKLFLFDNNGKFLRKIGRYGQGPEDYLYISNIFIHGDFIFLMSQYKVLIYHTNGSLVENINLHSNEILQEYFIQDILPIRKDTFVMNVTSFYRHYPKAVLFDTYQSSVKTINEYPNYVKLDKLSSSSNYLEFGIMYRYKDQVRIYKAINDTIFTIDQNTEMKDAFIFDLGKYKPTLSFIEGKEGDRDSPLETGKNYIIPNLIFESFNHLFLSFSFGNHAPEPIDYISKSGAQTINSQVYGVFDKRTGNLKLMKQPIKGKLGFKNDIDNGPVIWPRYISSNNELVTYISVEEFMDYYEKIENPTPQMTEIAQKIAPDDNQIVIIAKLK